MPFVRRTRETSSPAPPSRSSRTVAACRTGTGAGLLTGPRLCTDADGGGGVVGAGAGGSPPTTREAAQRRWHRLLAAVRSGGSPSAELDGELDLDRRVHRQ